MLVTFKSLCSTGSMVLVWVELQSEFSIRSFEFVLGGVRLDPENFIEVFTLFYPVQGRHDLSVSGVDYSF